MKPPVCEVCGDRPGHDGLDGFRTLAFEDYVPLPDGMAGHPDGLVWLCGPHADAGEQLTKLPWSEARRRLARLRADGTEHHGNELATWAWCVRTGGALTAAQKRHLTARSLASYARHAGGLARLALRVRPAHAPAAPPAPDARLIDTALRVARDQGIELEGHGLRTWLFGGLLAAMDGTELDAELFAVASITHDAGAVGAVEGEDFTIRSAAVAVRTFEAAGIRLDPARREELRDGIVAHATAGVDARSSPIGTYVQAGAMLDLVGMRMADLPTVVVDDIYDRHPPGRVGDTIRRLIDEEASAVPDGRFALLRRLGLTTAISLSPSLRGR